MPGIPAYRLLSSKGRRRMASRRLLIDASHPRRFDADEWADALVIVERGGLTLEWQDGARLAFSPGDVLCLRDLALATLQATTSAPVLLLVLRR